MATDKEIEAILTIIRRERACHFPELTNRAWIEFQISSTRIGPACTILQDRGRVKSSTVPGKDAKKKDLSFVYHNDVDQTEIDQIVKHKTNLLAQHYDLSDEIGHHGENLVETVCHGLGYTAIEVRKEKHGGQDLGIAKRDIDVFAKHPLKDYYQNIEVKNRRQAVLVPELSHVSETTRIASSRWGLTIHSALVAPFVQKITQQTALQMSFPIAFSGGMFVPEKHRALYDQLNQELALSVTITDKPTTTLINNFRKFIRDYNYPKSKTLSS